jgi:putative cell wall-binding protein
MRPLSALLSLALVPVAVVLPTTSSPHARPHPVAPRVHDLNPSGVDPASLAEVRSVAERRARRAPKVDGTVAAAVPAATADPSVLTAPKATQGFDLVGVTWDSGSAPDGTAVQVRVREDGTWTDWEPMPVVDGGPDDGSPEALRARGRTGTEPLLSTGADGVQVRVDTPDGTVPSGLRVELVDPGSSAADAALTPQDPPASAQARAPRPAIITRAQWGADETLRNGDPGVNAQVRALFLHHTAGSNSYSAAQAAAQVRSIYAYHTRSLGWSDIGYNFLVDRFGRVYEGRYGSITQASRGAHAGGFNTDTMGVSAMGNFDVARPPAALVNGASAVMGWLAERFDINPSGRVVLTSEGGGTSRYAAGVRVTVNTISGHRDVGLTACPGQYLYPYLGTIRSRTAAALAPGLASPRASARTVPYGTSAVTVSGSVPTTMTWTLTVTPRCGPAFTRTVSGRSPYSVAATWDLRDGTGTAVRPGVYDLSLASRSPVGSAPTFRAQVEVLATPTSPDPACAVQRLSGADRYATSVAVAREAYPSATTALIVNGSDTSLVDGVVAAPLARKRGAPILLTTAAALPTAVADDLRARHVTHAIVVGGPGVVSGAVVAQLTSLGVTSVERLGGVNRFETAAAVATAMGTAGGAFVVSGMNPSLVDAVAASGAGAALGRPVLLSSAQSLPAVSGSALRTMGVTSVDIVGSTAVVPSKVAQQLGAYGVTSVARRAGGDRYATAAALAVAYASLRASGVVVAPGDQAHLIDGLVGGAFGKLTLLTLPGGLPAATRSWLVQYDPPSVTVTGGTASVSTATLAAIMDVAR